MLISPIMLVPEAVPFANVQQAYLKASAEMRGRNGPRLPARNAKKENAIVVTKQDFAPRSVLIAPPIIFQVLCVCNTTCVRACVRACVRMCALQSRAARTCIDAMPFDLLHPPKRLRTWTSRQQHKTRRAKSSVCPFNYSSTFIAQQHGRMVRRHTTRTQTHHAHTRTHMRAHARARTRTHTYSYSYSHDTCRSRANAKRLISVMTWS